MSRSTYACNSVFSVCFCMKIGLPLAVFLALNFSALGCLTSVCQVSALEVRARALAFWACQVQSPSAPQSTVQAYRPAWAEIREEVSAICFLFN